MGEQRGFLLEFQIERGKLGLLLACSANRTPHYVVPIGFPLLYSEKLHRPKATRHLVSIILSFIFKRISVTGTESLNIKVSDF